MRESGWASTVSRAYYSLGVLHYFHEWVVLTGVLSALSAILSKQLYGAPLLSYLLIVLSIVFLGSGIYAWWRSGHALLRSPNPFVKTLSLEYTLIIKSKYSYCQKCSIHAEALRHGIESFRYPFRWSGSGKVVPHMEEGSKHTIEIVKNMYGPGDIVVIHLERHAKAGDKFWCNFYLDLEDDAGIAKSYLSTNVFSFVDILKMRVIIPADDKITKYRRMIYLSTASQIPVWEEEVVSMEGSKEMSWNIPRPRIQYKYQISW